MTLGDFNRDGHLDVVAAVVNVEGTAEVRLAVSLGAGDGDFGPPILVPFLSGTNPVSMTTADFNQDGNLDVAVSTRKIGFYDPGGVAILLGDGSGRFGPATRVGGGLYGQIISADFNGDGSADLAVGNETAEVSGIGVYVLLGDGTGQFTVQSIAVAGGGGALAVADFNGDGKQDIAVAQGATRWIAMLLGNGTGGFATPFTAATLSYRVASISAADFNGDGKTDLGAANSSDSGGQPAISASLIFGDGSGAFSSITDYPVAAHGFNSEAVAADFTGDAKVDLAVLNNDGSVTLLVGDGLGAVASSITTSAAGNSPSHLVAGDLNEDGRADLAIRGNGGFSVLINAGNGGFGTPSLNLNLSAGGAGNRNFAIADFNGDGRPDVAAGDRISAIHVFLANDQGAFAEPITTDTTTSGDVVAAADFDGDGRPDLIVSTDSGVYLNLGTGSGTFTVPGVSVATLYEQNGLAIGDYNGDGRPDVAVTHRGNPYVAVPGVNLLLGSGLGGFSSPVSIAAGDPSSPIATDLNGDGSSDLVFSNVLLGQVGVILGSSSGSFGPAHFYAVGATGATTGGVAAGDFNGDGKTDVLVVYQGNTQGDEGVAVLLGSGTGSLGTPTKIRVTGWQVGDSLTVGDLDGDGIVDAAMTATGAAAVGLLVGDGRGGFRPAGAILAGGDSPTYLQAADFNADGKLDLVVLNDRQLAISVFHNISVPVTSCPRVSVTDVSLTEGDAGTGTATFTVSLSAPPVVPVEVYYMTADGSATSGSDYAPRSGVLSFGAGSTEASVAVSITGDTVVEGDETVYLNVIGVTNAIIADSQGIAFVLNDDAAAGGPTISIDDRSVAEGAAANAAFRVWLSAPSSETVTVSYGTADESAIAGSDYTATLGTLTFTPGRTNHSIFVPIANDGIAEGTETFLVNLTSPAGAALGDGQAMGTILGPPPAMKIAMYRAYNGNTDYHFFTTELASKDFAVGVLGFQDESNPIPFYVWNVAQPSAVPLFRMYNPNLGRHFYTAEVASRDFLMGIGMIYEKDEGFIYPSPTPGATELFRLYNNNSGTHLFTADANQRDFILATFPGVWVQHTSVGYVFTGP